FGRREAEIRRDGRRVRPINRSPRRVEILGPPHLPAMDRGGQRVARIVRRRDAIRRLVGHMVSLGLIIWLSRGCLPQRAWPPAASSRFSWSRQVPEVLQRSAMSLAILALRQPAQPPSLEMPTPERSYRLSLMQAYPSQPA